MRGPDAAPLAASAAAIAANPAATRGAPISGLPPSAEPQPLVRRSQSPHPPATKSPVTVAMAPSAITTFAPEGRCAQPPADNDSKHSTSKAGNRGRDRRRMGRAPRRNWLPTPEQQMCPSKKSHFVASITGFSPVSHLHGPAPLSRVRAGNAAVNTSDKTPQRCLTAAHNLCNAPRRASPSPGAPSGTDDSMVARGRSCSLR